MIHPPPVPAASPSARPRHGWRFDLGFAVVLVALIWTAYAPALHHPHRADQWCYLVDTRNCRGFWETLEYSYSYNRTRTVMPGDTELFRPVLFALLAAEKCLFEGNIAGYQAAEIALHALVCFLLLTFMRSVAGHDRPNAETSISARLLPCALTAFFAVNPAVQELVIWNHLGGYLLFLAFVLGAAILLIRHLNGEAAGRWRSPALWGAWALALLAAFTHELGQAAAVLLGLFVACGVYPNVGSKRGVAFCLLFAAIVPCYQGANALDRRAHAGQFQPDGSRDLVRERAFSRLTPEHAARFAVYTGVQPFFPSLLEGSFGRHRWNITESLWEGDARRSAIDRAGSAAFVSLAAFVLAGALTVVAVWRLVRSAGRVPRLAFLVGGGLFAAFTALMVLGRMNLRLAPDVLSLNSYYAYLGFLFILAAAGAAWPALDRGGRWIGGARCALIGALAVLTALSVPQVRQANHDVGHALKDYSRPLRTLNDFVNEHRAEPDFSLAVDYANSDSIPSMHGVPITDTVFARWLSERPKYQVAIRGGRVLVLTAWFKSS